MTCFKYGFYFDKDIYLETFAVGENIYPSNLELFHSSSMDW
jgi:hypothetical protein